MTRNFHVAHACVELLSAKPHEKQNTIPPPLDHQPKQVMEAEVWHIDEYQQALEDDANCTPAEMARHFDKVLSKMRVDVMGHGNLGRKEAEALAPAISDALLHPQPLPEAELPTRHGLRLLAAGESGGAGVEGGSGNGVVVVDLTAATAEEKNSAVQVGSLFSFFFCFRHRFSVVSVGWGGVV